jgi:hypothetical protein
MPKTELKRYFEWFMEIRLHRVKVLTEAVNGTAGYEEWLSDETPASLEALGKWFAEQANVRARTDQELKRINEQLVFPIAVPGEELTTQTFSLAMDIGMYLSQVFLKNHKTLRWDQPLGNKAFIDYGQPVLVKFKSGPFNPVRMVVTLAYGLVSRKKTAEGLRNIYDIWSNMVQTF